VQADVNLLNAPHCDNIEISSSSYELSLFSSKVGSGHGVGVSAAPEKSSSVSLGDLYHEISSTGGAGGEGASMTVMRGHLEALMPHLLSGTRWSKKRKILES
jgi:hypothetical protein